MFFATSIFLSVYLLVVTTWVPVVGLLAKFFTIEGASWLPSLGIFNFSASGSGCLNVGFGELIILSKSPFCTCSTFLNPFFGLPLPVTGFFFSPAVSPSFFSSASTFFSSPSSLLSSLLSFLLFFVS